MHKSNPLGIDVRTTEQRQSSDRLLTKARNAASKQPLINTQSNIIIDKEEKTGFFAKMKNFFQSAINTALYSIGINKKEIDCLRDKCCEIYTQITDKEHNKQKGITITEKYLAMQY